MKKTASTSYKLSRAQRDDIIAHLLDAGPYDTLGLLARLGREHGVSRQRIYEIRQGLEARRLFFSRQYRGFVGLGKPRCRFLVSTAVFQESVRDVLEHPPARGDPFTQTEAEEMMLDPRLWNPDEVGPIPGVSWLPGRTPGGEHEPG